MAESSPRKQPQKVPPENNPGYGKPTYISHVSLYQKVDVRLVEPCHENNPRAPEHIPLHLAQGFVALGIAYGLRRAVGEGWPRLLLAGQWGD